MGKKLRSFEEAVVIISWVPKGEHNLREVVRVPREKAVIENCVDSGWGLRPHLFLGSLIKRRQ